MKTKHLLLFMLAFVFVAPLHAQLRKPYKTDTYTLTRLQFPTEPQQGERARTVNIKVTKEARIGGGDKKGKSDSRLGKLTSAASKVVDDEAGAISDKDFSGGTSKLIPEVFPAEGDYYLEVIVSSDERAEHLDLEEILQDPEAHGSNNSIGAKMEYKLYDKPEGESNRKLIHSNGPYWVVGEGEGDMMAGAEEIDKSRVDLAERWAREEVMNMYGLGFSTIDVPVYRVKGLDRKEKKEAKDKQEELGSLVQSFQRSEEYKNKVKKNLAYWEKMLKKHQPGETKTRKAAVNDENVWTVYSNLAVANFLMGNESKTHSNLDEAMKRNFIDWKETTNKKGEVIGRSKAGIDDTESIANLHIFKRVTDSYYAGIKAMNPKFINFLADKKARQKASKTAREWGINVFLSQLITELDVPVEFVNIGLGSDQPKQITGTIGQDGNKLADYTIKKSFLFPLTKSYKINIETADGSVKTKQKNGSIMLPNYSYDPYFKLATRIHTRDVDTDSQGKWRAGNGIKIMYDFDGNIILENKMLKEKFVYQQFVGTNKEDALGYRDMAYQFTLEDDLSVKSVDFSSERIDRDRESGLGAFFGATFDKMLDPNFVLATDIQFEEDYSGTYSFSDEEIITTAHGETKQKNIDMQKDEKGNWTKMTIGETEVSRTIEY